MKKKLAIIDLLAHYPPIGGAGLDVFKTAFYLQDDYEVCLFYPKWHGAFPRGTHIRQPPVKTQAAPIKDVNRENIVSALTQSVKKFAPSAVMLADGWMLKPYLLQALASDFPIILRLYAFEMLCPRNNERWLFDHSCSNTALLDCRKCLICAQEYDAIVKQHKGEDGNPLTDEMDIARIWDGSYCDVLKSSLKNAHRVIVYNSDIARHLKEQLGIKASVVPGGFEPEHQSLPPDNLKQIAKEFKILVFGRMNDPAKGAEVLLNAGRLLRNRGVPLSMTITRDARLSEQWIDEIGWQTRDNIKKLLNTHHAVVVPSLWEEAFGMTWLEALAAGVPVVASAVGGPKEYLTDAENALLFPPGDHEMLAAKLLTLYNNPELRKKLSYAGYEYAHNKFTWQNVVKKTAALIKTCL